MLCILGTDTSVLAALCVHRSLRAPNTQTFVDMCYFMYTQVEVKMSSANSIWLIRGPTHPESTEGMETQKCCMIGQLLEKQDESHLSQVQPPLLVTVTMARF